MVFSKLVRHKQGQSMLHAYFGAYRPITLAGIGRHTIDTSKTAKKPSFWEPTTRKNESLQNSRRPRHLHPKRWLCTKNGRNRFSGVEMTARYVL